MCWSWGEAPSRTVISQNSRRRVCRPSLDRVPPSRRLSRISESTRLDGSDLFLLFFPKHTCKGWYPCALPWRTLPLWISLRGCLLVTNGPWRSSCRMSNGTVQRSQRLCDVLPRPSAEGIAWVLRDRRAPAKALSLTHSPPMRANRDKPLALSLSILPVLFLVEPSSATVSVCSNIISMPACLFGVWPHAAAMGGCPRQPKESGSSLRRLARISFSSRR